jgi:hypothetical protein
MHTIDVKELEADSTAIELDPNSLVTKELAADSDHIWLLPNSTRYVAGSTQMNQMFVFDLAEQKIVRKLTPGL